MFFDNLERFLGCWNSNLIVIKIVYCFEKRNEKHRTCSSTNKWRFLSNNLFDLFIHIYIFNLITFNLKIEIFTYLQTYDKFHKIFPILGSTLYFQLNEEEWKEKKRKKEECKKNKKKKKIRKRGAEGTIKNVPFHCRWRENRFRFAARFGKRALFCPIPDFGLNYAPLQFHWSADRVGKSDNQRAGQKAGVNERLTTRYRW